MNELARRINASGLWASYGDAASLFDIGGARAMAQKNWAVNARLARADGTTHSDNPDRSEHWIKKNPAQVLVNTILGYSHGPDAVKPEDLRLSEGDLLALAGLAPSSIRLRVRVAQQALRLETWLADNSGDADNLHWREVRQACSEAWRLHDLLWIEGPE